MVIYPYRHLETWVFDDDSVGLVREPFVSGIPEMIYQLVQEIIQAEFGFKILFFGLFSAIPFSGYQAELTWLREEFGGNWVQWQEKSLEGWPCPALFKYFDAAPLKLYCQALKLGK